MNCRYFSKPAISYRLTFLTHVSLHRNEENVLRIISRFILHIKPSLCNAVKLLLTVRTKEMCPYNK